MPVKSRGRHSRGSVMFSAPIAKSVQRNAINRGRSGTPLQSRVNGAESSHDLSAHNDRASNAIEPALFDFAKFPVFPPRWPRLSWSTQSERQLFGVLQAKLAIESVHDPAEAEADAMAAHALGNGGMGGIAPHSSPAAVQRKCACSGSAEKCDKCKEEESGLVQRKAAANQPAATAPSIVHRALSSGGKPLDTATRAYMEPR